MSIPSTIHGMIHSVQRAERSRVSDAELMRRYRQQGDQAAFATIVDRYGSLVRVTCLRTTSDSHHADDAFQATFLTLARKAHTIRRPEALPAWLVRVARHASLKRRQTTSLAAEPLDPARSPLDQLSAREFLTMFDEELDRLPANYRSALLLCLVEGHTVEETAKQLGTTHGTVRGWLQRGREKLRQRLSRRGLDLSAVLPAVALYYGTPVSAAVHQSLQSVLNGSAAIPANISALMSGTSLTGMLGSLAAVIVLGAILAGASLWAKPEQPPTVVASTPQPPAPMPIETDPARLPQDAIARIGSASFRHGGEVTALAFFKDNRYLASASPADFENSVRVWEMATGKEKLRVPVESNSREGTVGHRPVAVTFSEDGHQLRVLDWATYRALDLNSGKELIRHDFGGHDNTLQSEQNERVIGAAISPTGKHFAVVRATGELIIGDTTTGKPLVTIQKSFVLEQNHGILYTRILYSPDGKTVCVPAGVSLMVFDTGSGKQVANHPLTEIRFEHGEMTSPTELTCIVRDDATRKSFLVITDLATHKTISRNEISGSNGLCISPDRKKMALGLSQLQIIDRNTNQVVHRLPNVASTACLTFSSDARWIARTIVYSGCVKLWNVETETSHPLCSEGYFTGTSFEDDGQLTVFVDGRRDYYQWRTGQKMGELNRDQAFSRNVTYSLDRCREVSQGDPKAPQQDKNNLVPIIVKEVATGKELNRFPLNTFCQPLRFTPDQGHLIGITSFNTIHLWDLKSNQEIWTHKIPNASGTMGTNDPQFSSDGRSMAIGCNYGAGAGNGYAIRVFDLVAKKETSLIEAPYFLFGGVSLSPDGRYVAGGGMYRPFDIPDGDAVFVWDAATGKLLRKLSGHELGNNSHTNAELHSKFTPDGRKLFTADGKGAIRLWELSSGQVLWKSVENHGNPRFSFSPDGGVIASSSYDAPVLLWDLYGNAKGPSKKAEPIETEKLWAELAGDDAGRAFSAIRQLCAAPDQAIKLIREKLPPTKPRTDGAIGQWIKNLDSAVFAEREQASKELLNILEEVEPRLRQVRAATTSDEVRRRIDALLLKTGKPSPDRLRQERSLDVLEHLGTKEAKQYLEVLAKGAPDCSQTIDAQATLSRMSSLKTQP